MKDFLMTLDWPALIGTIWTVVLLPLVLYAKNKIDEVAKAHKVEKYSNMLYTAVEYVAKDIQQEIVDDIKGTSEWTPEKIEEIKELAVNKAISSMSYEGYKILTEVNSDFDSWLDAIIQAKLYELKNK